MIQLIYASAATEPFTAVALQALLAKARNRNALYQVTGLLLYHGGSFLQVLEGPESGVDLILASIHRDPRHHSSRTLARTAVQAREFATWNMGFADTTTQTRPPGMIDFYRDPAAHPEAPTKARQFLRFFREGLYRQSSA